MTCAEIAFTTYQDTLRSAQLLQQSIASLLADPSSENLSQARKAWFMARIPYLQSEAFRFSNGPIDAIEQRINAWPIDENYIDYTSDNPAAGIINNPALYPEISERLIIEINEKEGEKNISIGYHAIEFLLWGQDMSATGAGNRQATDFLPGSGPAVDRRRAYLTFCANLLVTDISSLVSAWDPAVAGNYRGILINHPNPSKPLGEILHGIGVFSGVELAGERLTVSYKTKEQEDEHSCFSDNTHNDVRYDTVGIENVYFGHYTRSDGTVISGPSLYDVVAVADPSLATLLAERVRKSVDLAKDIPAPFDQAILGPDSGVGRQAIRKTIEALQAQAAALAEANRLIVTGQANTANLK